MSPSIIPLILVLASSTLSDQTRFSGRIDPRLPTTQLTVIEGVIVAHDDTTTLDLGLEGTRGLMPARCTDQRGGLLVVLGRDARGDVLHALGPGDDGRLDVVFSAPLPAPALSLAAGGAHACRVAVVVETGAVLTASLRDAARFAVQTPMVEVPDDPREHPRGPAAIIDDDRVVVADGAGVRIWSDRETKTVRAALPAWPVSPASASARGALLATPDGSVWHVDDAGVVERLPGSGAETGPIHSGLTLISGALWWGTLDGRVFSADDRGVRLAAAALGAGIRQPLLFADLVDRGRPQVIAVVEDATVALLDPAGVVLPLRLALGARALGVVTVLVDDEEAPLLTAPSGRVRFLGPTFTDERLEGPPASPPAPDGAVDLAGTIVGVRSPFALPRAGSSTRIPRQSLPIVDETLRPSTTPQPEEAPASAGCTASPPSTFGLGLVLLLAATRRRVTVVDRGTPPVRASFSARAGSPFSSHALVD